MGGQRPRDPRPGQPATDTTKPRHDTPPPPKKKNRQHLNTPPTQAAPQEGRGQAGHTHNRTDTPTTQPRRAGHSRNPSPARTPTQHTPARKGGVQAGRAHKHTHAPTPQPGVAGRGTAGSASTTQSPYMGQLLKTGLFSLFSALLVPFATFHGNGHPQNIHKNGIIH